MTYNPRYQNYYCEPSCDLELNDDGSCPDADCAYIYESAPGVFTCACEDGPNGLLNGVLEDDGSCTTSCDTVYQFYGDSNYWTCMDHFVYGGYYAYVYNGVNPYADEVAASPCTTDDDKEW